MSGAPSRRRRDPRTSIGRGSILMRTSASAERWRPPLLPEIELLTPSLLRLARQCSGRSRAHASTSGYFGTAPTSAGAGPPSTRGAPPLIADRVEAEAIAPAPDMADRG